MKVYNIKNKTLDFMKSLGREDLIKYYHSTHVSLSALLCAMADCPCKIARDYLMRECKRKGV